MPLTHIAVLENPAAGSGKSARIAAYLVNELSKRAIPAVVFKKDWPPDFSEFSDIWVIGGDGTINYFINKYPDCNKPLALFKGGTGNDFAWKLYGNSNIEEQLHIVLNATPRFIDAGKFNDTLYLNCLGVGFDGETLSFMNAIRFVGGHIGYLLSVLVKICSFKEAHFEIEVNNENWSDRFLLVMIVNSSRAGGGFFVAPHAEINDGLLNMVLCKKLSVFKRLKYLPVIEKGKHLHLPFVIHRTGKNFSIQCEKTMAVQVDGELHFAKDIQVTAMGGKFLFRY